MSATFIWRRALTIAAVTAMTGAGVAAVPNTAYAQILICPIGNVCLKPASGGPVVRVPEGRRATFNAGLAVSEVANSTRLNYCVASEPFSYALRPGAGVVRDHTVFGLGPAAICIT